MTRETIQGGGTPDPSTAALLKRSESGIQRSQRTEYPLVAQPERIFLNRTVSTPPLRGETEKYGCGGRRRGEKMEGKSILHAKRGHPMGVKIRWFVLGAALAFGCAATGAVATGQIGSDDRVQACAKTENGQLRLVADAAECLPSENAVSWPASLPSTGGGTAFQTVTVTVPPQPPLTSASASCPAGSRVVGGGGTGNPVSGANVIATYPANETTWAVTAATNPAAVSLSVYAICATGAQGP